MTTDLTFGRFQDFMFLKKCLFLLKLIRLVNNIHVVKRLTALILMYDWLCKNKQPGLIQHAP